jgi:SAM-dependent methyltransferase
MTSFELSPETYDAALARGLEVTGESKDFYARERVRWTARRLRERGWHGGRVLDFGCGTGATTSLLLQQLDASHVVGTDTSSTLLNKARERYGTGAVSFAPDSEIPSDRFDLVYLNGVFHHIEPPKRVGVVARIFKSLNRGGYVAFWENNPFNPGTRYVMSRISFDRDARMLRPAESRNLLRRAGFEALLTDYRFVFPRMLKFLRGLEPRLVRLPLGGQYLILGRRPDM